jgi:hypothetical protein
MAGELTINGTLAYNDGDSADSLDISDLSADISTNEFVHLIQSISITEVAINLGGLTAIGWAFFKNLDTINYIDLQVGTAGAIFAHLLPGESCGPIKLGSGAQVPYAIANLAPCKMEYLIVAA